MLGAGAEASRRGLLPEQSTGHQMAALTLNDHIGHPQDNTIWGGGCTERGDPVLAFASEPPELLFRIIDYISLDEFRRESFTIEAARAPGLQAENPRVGALVGFSFPPPPIMQNAIHGVSGSI